MELGFMMTKKWGKALFWVEDFRMNSLCFNTLSFFVKEQAFIRSGREPFGVYTDNLFLPLARLRLMTLRPLEELMRTKKPWVRDRFRLLG
jgi:hypothetical protein